jgi:hypothetical protein
MLGADKIPVLIAEKAQSLIQQLVPTITQIVEKTGIQNIGQPNMVMPSVCLPADDLQNIIQLRNNMVDKINSTTKTIELLSKPIDILNTVVTTTSTILDATKIARTGANIALGFLPITPGAAPAAINVLGDLLNLLDPQVQIAKNAISSISGALDYTNEILFKLLNLLKDIDSYLTGCGAGGSDSSTPLISTNDYLNAVEQQYTKVQESPIVSQIYNGFTLDIVEEQFSPTIKRIKGVAKNPQGIILLQTPLSFTTTPQVLIEELKLIIDRSNLKAY